MNISKLVLTLHLVAVTATFGTAAYATPSKGACAGDIKKLCADAKPGAGGVASCLKKHDADLSPGCKTHQDNMNKKAEAMNAACGDDIQKVCPDAKPGKGLMACLHGKAADLSQTCNELIAKKKPMSHHVKS